MSEDFETLKKYYEKKYWDKTRLKYAVVKGRITAEEYETITGEKYSAD